MITQEISQNALIHNAEDSGELIRLPLNEISKERKKLSSKQKKELSNQFMTSNQNSELDTIPEGNKNVFHLIKDGQNTQNQNNGFIGKHNIHKKSALFDSRVNHKIQDEVPSQGSTALAHNIHDDHFLKQCKKLLSLEKVFSLSQIFIPIILITNALKSYNLFSQEQFDYDKMRIELLISCSLMLYFQAVFIYLASSSKVQKLRIQLHKKYDVKNETLIHNLYFRTCQICSQLFLKMGYEKIKDNLQEIQDINLYHQNFVQENQYQYDKDLTQKKQNQRSKFNNKYQTSSNLSKQNTIKELSLQKQTNSNSINIQGSSQFLNKVRAQEENIKSYFGINNNEPISTIIGNQLKDNSSFTKNDLTGQYQSLQLQFDRTFDQDFQLEESKNRHQNNTSINIINQASRTLNQVQIQPRNTEEIKVDSHTTVNNNNVENQYKQQKSRSNQPNQRKNKKRMQLGHIQIQHAQERETIRENPVQIDSIANFSINREQFSHTSSEAFQVNLSQLQSNKEQSSSLYNLTTTCLNIIKPTNNKASNSSMTSLSQDQFGNTSKTQLQLTKQECIQMTKTLDQIAFLYFIGTFAYFIISKDYYYNSSFESDLKVSEEHIQGGSNKDHLKQLMHLIPYGIAVLNLEDIANFNLAFAKIVGFNKKRKLIVDSLTKFQRQVKNKDQKGAVNEHLAHKSSTELKNAQFSNLYDDLVYILKNREITFKDTNHIFDIYQVEKEQDRSHFKNLSGAKNENFFKRTDSKKSKVNNNNKNRRNSRFSTHKTEDPVNPQQGKKIYSISISPITWLGKDSLLITVKDITHEKVINQKELMDKLRNMIFKSFSHELKTPLNGIIMSVDTSKFISKALILKLQKERQRGLLQLDESIQQSNQLKLQIKVMESCSYVLKNIMHDFFDYHQLQTNELTMNVKEFEVHSFIRDIQRIVKQQMKFDKVQFKCFIEYDNPGGFAQNNSLTIKHSTMMKADKERLQQILLNLLMNSIKFTNRGSIELKILIQLHTTPQSIIFKVQDTGTGIEQDRLPLIFNLFEKDENSSINEYLNLNHKSARMGLPISQNLCQLMGGQIRVRSKINEGSVFSFRLPLNPQDMFENKLALQSQKISNILENTKSEFSMFRSIAQDPKIVQHKSLPHINENQIEDRNSQILITPSNNLDSLNLQSYQDSVMIILPKDEKQEDKKFKGRKSEEDSKSDEEEYCCGLDDEEQSSETDDSFDEYEFEEEVDEILPNGRHQGDNNDFLFQMQNKLGQFEFVFISEERKSGQLSGMMSSGEIGLDGNLTPQLRRSSEKFKNQLLPVAKSSFKKQEKTRFKSSTPKEDVISFSGQWKRVEQQQKELDKMKELLIHDSDCQSRKSFSSNESNIKQQKDQVQGNLQIENQLSIQSSRRKTANQVIPKKFQGDLLLQPANGKNKMMKQASLRQITLKNKNIDESSARGSNYSKKHTDLNKNSEQYSDCQKNKTDFLVQIQKQSPNSALPRNYGTYEGSSGNKSPNQASNKNLAHLQKQNQALEKYQIQCSLGTPQSAMSPCSLANYNGGENNKAQLKNQLGKTLELDAASNEVNMIQKRAVKQSTKTLIDQLKLNQDKPMDRKLNMKNQESLLKNKNEESDFRLVDNELKDFDNTSEELVDSERLSDIQYDQRQMNLNAGRTLFLNSSNFLEKDQLQFHMRFFSQDPNLQNQLHNYKQQNQTKILENQDLIEQRNFSSDQYDKIKMSQFQLNLKQSGFMSKIGSQIDINAGASQFHIKQQPAIKPIQEYMTTPRGTLIHQNTIDNDQILIEEPIDISSPYRIKVNQDKFSNMLYDQRIHSDKKKQKRNQNLRIPQIDTGSIRSSSQQSYSIKSVSQSPSQRDNKKKLRQSKDKSPSRVQPHYTSISFAGSNSAKIFQNSQNQYVASHEEIKFEEDNDSKQSSVTSSKKPAAFTFQHDSISNLNSENRKKSTFLSPQKLQQQLEPIRNQKNYSQNAGPNLSQNTSPNKQINKKQYFDFSGEDSYSDKNKESLRESKCPQILVVDDVQMNRYAVEQMLSLIFNIKVLQAENGQNAIDTLIEHYQVSSDIAESMKETGNLFPHRNCCNQETCKGIYCTHCIHG
eukprot:403356521